MSEMGARIRARRKERCLTVEELSTKVGINKSTLVRYESGAVTNIKPATLESLGRALQVSPAWILGDTDDMTPESDAFLLSPSDRKDICHIIEATRQLLYQDGLTFNGTPADHDSVQLILNALMVSLETAKMQNEARWAGGFSSYQPVPTVADKEAGNG